MQVALVLILLILAVILFSLELLPLDVTALALLSAVILLGLVRPPEAFAGFGSDTIIMIAGLFTMTAALVRTGVIETMGRVLHRYGGDNPYWLAVMIMLTVAVVSAFISNTAATAVFLPATIGLARRAKLSPSKFLMPLAFASILTSSVTLISTSTNIVVSGILTQSGMDPMGMFELAPVGIPITVAGLAYMFTLGMKLLPDRADEGVPEEYGLRDYLTEVVVLPDSPLVGKPLAESKLGSDMDLLVIGIVRGQDQVIAPRPDEVLQPDDILLVEARAEDIIRIKDIPGLEIKADVKLPQGTLQAMDAQLVEAMVLSGSGLRGRTLREVRFYERYGLSVLAINRRGVTLRSKISRLPLRFGDVLLLQGSRDRILRLMGEGYFTLLSDVTGLRPRSPKAKYALAVFALAIGLGTFKVMPFPSAMVLGTLAMFLSRAITPAEAYATVEWRILVLIASMMAFGVAMEQTGTASLLAQTLLRAVGGYGPEAVLAAFFLLTVLLTQPMSNQAAALILVPVALETASRMQLNARPFAMMIAVAASCSYLTPLEPSCVLVYGPGRYKFVDFLKVGALLTALIFGLSMLIVPAVWPLQPR